MNTKIALVCILLMCLLFVVVSDALAKTTAKRVDDVGFSRPRIDDVGFVRQTEPIVSVLEFYLRMLVRTIVSA